MIDARRWILVEAWLSLGLRIEWCPSYDVERYRDAWQTDDDGGARFVYAGLGTWRVLDPTGRTYGPSPIAAPQLSTDALKHELAHYLAATEAERLALNFGIPAGDPADVEQRERWREAVPRETIAIEVDVTLVEIAMGVRCMTGECPIALAVQRALPEARGVRAGVGFVFTRQVSLFLNGVEHRAELPQAARDFIDAFDQRLAVSPLTFPLELRRAA